MRFVGCASFGLGGRALPQVGCPASVVRPLSSVLPGCVFCRSRFCSAGWGLCRFRQAVGVGFWVAGGFGAVVLQSMPNMAVKLTARRSGGQGCFFISGQWLRRGLSSGQPLTFTLCFKFPSSMSIFAFILISIGLAIFEWLLSWSIASSPLVGEKGFGSDVLAAMVMVVIGGAYEMVGNHIAWQCRIPMQLIGTDMTECIKYGESVMSFGEMIKTTLGINSVLAAILLYVLFTYGPNIAFRIAGSWRGKS